MRVNATNVSYDSPSYSSLTPHDPISITSDNNFTDYSFPGTGTEEDPYVIEGYNITTTSNRGIYITDTTKNFTVRNCYVKAGEYGIYIRNVAGGTATVINSMCTNNNNIGIYLYSSGSSTVANNTFNNNFYGIFFYSSDFCVFTYNVLQENEDYGIRLYSDCDNNIIHHNTFVDNNPGGTSQALDAGSNNFWYDSTTLEGNYWSDWSGTGSYSIDGAAGAIDLYPLDEPVDIGPPLIVNIIHSPSTPTELDTVSINATVTDYSGVKSVTLHYRINDGTLIEVSMTLVSGDLYSVTIGPFAVSDIIEYYVSAEDNSFNNNEAINDNTGLYYSFTVSEAISEFQTLSPLLSLTIILLFLGFSFVLLKRRKK